MLMMLASYCQNANPCPDDAHDARDTGLALTAHVKHRVMLRLLMLACYCSNANPCPDDAHYAGLLLTAHACS